MSNEPRQLTPTEVNVILDRLFSNKRRMKVKQDLLNVWIQPNVINVTAQATLTMDLDDVYELASARDLREAEIMQETKKSLGKGKKDAEG